MPIALPGPRTRVTGLNRSGLAIAAPQAVARASDAPGLQHEALAPAPGAGAREADILIERVAI